MQKRKLRVGIIGLGRMGNIHFNHLLKSIPDAILVAVADAKYDRQQFEINYPGIYFSNNAVEIIQSDSIDTVVICTPTNTHASLVELAIANGKDVFCEKPLDLSLSVTTDIVHKAKSAGTMLTFGFNRRFDNEFKQLRKSIVEGRVGNPQIIKITNRDPGLPPVEFIKTSGGMFMDFSIHDFDMARYIMNSEVSSVFAKGLTFIDKEVEKAGDIDTALITLIFDNGAYAVIDNSREAIYGYDQRVEVFGKNGMILVENNLYNRNVIYDALGIHNSLPLKTFTDRYIRSYLSEMRLFVDAVINKKILLINGNDMIAATAIAYAARLSMKENRVVHLSEIKG